MRTLKEISVDNLNDAINRLGENTRLTTIATVTEDKNSLLKLGLQKQLIEQEIFYHRQKIEE